MRRPPFTLLILFVGLCQLWPVSGRAQPLGPSDDEFVAALLAGNQSQLRRIGERIGNSAIGKAMLSPNRLIAQAAVQSVSSMPLGHNYLPLLAKAAARPDHSIAARAARVAEDLSAALSPIELEEREVTNYELSQWQEQWIAIAQDTERFADIRVLSLESAVHLMKLQSVSTRKDIPWDKFLGDPNPAVRAALLSLLPPKATYREKVFSLLDQDPSLAVATRSAQWLCANPANAGQTPSLDTKGMGRVITLAANKGIPISQRAEMVPCLLGTDSDSKRSLRGLLQQSPPAIRKSIQGRIEKLRATAP